VVPGFIFLKYGAYKLAKPHSMFEEQDGDVVCEMQGAYIRYNVSFLPENCHSVNLFRDIQLKAPFSDSVYCREAGVSPKVSPERHIFDSGDN